MNMLFICLFYTYINTHSYTHVLTNVPYTSLYQRRREKFKLLYFASIIWLQNVRGIFVFFTSIYNTNFQYGIRIFFRFKFTLYTIYSYVLYALLQYIGINILLSFLYTYTIPICKGTFSQFCGKIRDHIYFISRNLQFSISYTHI